jgi:hypothetical protein
MSIIYPKKKRESQKKKKRVACPSNREGESSYQKVHLEVTDEGESWSIQAVKILAVRSGDVAARAPFVFPIVRSWPSDQARVAAHVVRAVRFLEGAVGIL